MRTVCLSLILVACCSAQDPSFLRKLTDEAALLSRGVLISKDRITEARTRSAAFQTALRDWIESQLPAMRAGLDVNSLGSRLHATLDQSGLLKADNSNGDPGFVSRVDLSVPKEAPEFLVVIAGVDIPCGEDDAVYVYLYGAGRPRRVLESQASPNHDEYVQEVRFSERDGEGRRLVLTLRSAIQCGSSWNGLSYDLFRLPGAGAVERVLSGEREMWFGAEEPYHVRLHTNDLLLQIRSHNRWHVLHYDLSVSPPQRIDPVALCPRDFVDEWWTQPWDEMVSRSLPDARNELRKWHQSISDDGGEFAYVQACAARPGEWQIGFNVERIGDKELADAKSIYFLVHGSQGFHYRMDDISYQRQPGCPGEGDPSGDSPSLFPSHDAPPVTPVQ